MPVVVTVKEPDVPKTNVALEALMIVGGAVPGATVSVKLCVALLPTP
jgi:hypothetical protein